MTPSPSASPTSPIKFGTSGWRGLIADDFTFANVRLAVTAIAGHVNDAKKNSTILVGYDPRFYSEEFSQLAVDILQQHKIKPRATTPPNITVLNFPGQMQGLHSPKSPKTSKLAPPNSPLKAPSRSHRATRMQNLRWSIFATPTSSASANSSNSMSSKKAKQNS
jgi:hypothetical protein